MKQKRKFPLLWLILPLLLLAGCKEKSGETVSTITPPISGWGEVYHVDLDGGSGSFYYSHELGSTPKDVYFVFTNTGFSQTTSTTVVSSQRSETDDSSSERRASDQELEEMDLVEYAREHGIGLRGKPEVTRFNANPLPPDPTYRKSGAEAAAPETVIASVGDSHTFIHPDDEGNLVTVLSELKKIVNVDSVTMNVWVENDSWGSCDKWHCLEQDMVDALADKFLRPGADNDIYDWVTDIYGSPWGNHSYSYLIDATANQQIDILFYDIDGDGDEADDDEPTGGVLGFFWPDKDNHISRMYSNRRLMFYMDSVLTATPSPAGSSWDVTDEWPGEMVATLAHEFQHMIHFYQKTVLRASMTRSDDWLNEMASMVTEDLLADKLEADGPRGVSYSDGTGGASGNTAGRLPLFNRYNYYEVAPSEWPSGYSALKYYAIDYAFGAYLARNFGGVQLFRAIVQNGHTDYRAVEQALTDLGYDETFATVLRKF
ncbi:MAG: hypothetical protein GY866_10795, partial [Proteobacteria bacterium]|nr:hypothetical protein [Pseudomonadota bacterium]